MIGLKIIPSWVYWIAIGVLTAGIGAQQMRVSGLKADIAEEKLSRTNETNERLGLVISHYDAIEKIKSRHAVDQQQREQVYAKTISALKTDAGRNAADAGRLRNSLAEYAASYRKPGDTDTAALGRAADRLAIVSTLLAEGLELEAESREVIQRRDAEVARVLEQVKIDRAAVSP